jgi:Tfp pilus assembly protein PilF
LFDPVPGRGPGPGGAKLVEFLSDCAELGQLFLEIKQCGRGLYWLYEALERDPEQQQAHRALAAYYERQGNADKAALHRRQVH